MHNISHSTERLTIVIDMDAIWWLILMLNFQIQCHMCLTNEKIHFNQLTSLVSGTSEQIHFNQFTNGICGQIYFNQFTNEISLICGQIHFN